MKILYFALKLTYKLNKMKKQLFTITGIALFTMGVSAQSSITSVQNNAAKFIKNKVKTMDVTGTPAQMLSLDWNTSKYDTVKRNLYTYDGSGNVTVDIEQDSAAGSFTNTSKTLNFYDASNPNILDSSLSYTWNTGSNSWDPFIKTIVKWTAFDLPEMFSIYFGTTLFIEINFEYDGNNNQLASVAKQLGVNSDSTYYSSLDANGNPLIEDKYKWNKTTSSWDLDGRETNTWDANDNKLTNLDENWNGSGYDNNNNTVYTYDGNNNEVTSTTSTWNGASFDNENLTSTFYKNNTELDYQTVQSWSGSGWDNSEKFIWNNNVITGITKALSNVSLFSVFPNPVSQHATILFNTTAIGNVNVTVFDANGKVVSVLANESMLPGLHSLSTSDLAKGSYFITLQNGNKLSTQKLIVE